MGNQVYGVSSPQVVGCEECLHELQNCFTFEEELRGSRLFKVAKVRCMGSKWSPRKVVKVFPYTKATFLIENVRKAVLPFCQWIEGAVNLLPLNIDFVTDKYAFIVRDFVDHSLTERLCTRPFLTMDEKRWVAFQLLSAISQLHSSTNADSTPRCHGDIKSQNVLLTAWGWLLLADPAPFKSTRLPADNPSEFTYFFDSSRRRVCYLAPERFIDPLLCSAGNGEAFGSAPGSLNLKGDVDPEEEVTVGEVADENLHAYEEDIMSSQSLTLTNTITGGKKSHSSEVDKATNRIGRLRLISGSCPDSASPTPPNVNMEKPLTEDFIRSFNEPHLRPSMDLFSVGCVLLEMFTDGSVAFTLSDLLAYRRHQNTRIMKLLASVPDPAARSLITELLSLHPEARGSAAHHLSTHRGGLFPEFFFTHLHPFMRSFLEPSMASPDARLRRIRANLPNLISNLLNEPSPAWSAGSIVLCNLITATLHLQYFNRANPVTSAYVDKTSSVSETSSIPSEDAKMDALYCLSLLIKRIPSLQLFNRLWPHFVEVLSDSRLHGSGVRCLALEGLMESLECATTIAVQGKGERKADLEEEECVAVISDTRFLNEFLLPSLSALTQDPSVDVRITLAQCLPRLTTVCSRLLDLARLRIMNEREEEGLDENLPEQTLLSDVSAALHLMGATLPTRGVNTGKEGVQTFLRERLVALFSDDTIANLVRRALIQTATGLAALATFLGHTKSSDAILSHMVTLLNDKKDANLRAAFFNQVAPLVSCFGPQSMTVLRPLLEQGLADPHEIALAACLRVLGHLERRHVLGAPVTIAFLQRILALTAHPAAHIRQACIAYVTAFARTGLKALTVAPNGPLDDHTIETTEGGTGVHDHRPYTCSIDLERFAGGKYGIATVYAHLFTREVTEGIFARPIGSNFTNDSVLLSALHPCLSHAFIETVVATLFDVVAEFRSEDPSVPPMSPRQLCADLKEHLQERQAARQTARKCETPWYPAPSSDPVAEVLNRLRQHEMTDQAENQLLRLAPLLMGLCQSAADSAEPGSRVSSMSATLRAPNQMAYVVPLSSGDLPRARLYPLPAIPSGVVCVRRPQPINSIVSTPELIKLSCEAKTTQYPLATIKTKPSFVDIISSRICQGRIPLPSNPPPRAVFARGLTVAAVSTPKPATAEARGSFVSLRVSNSSFNGSGRPSHTVSPVTLTSPQLRCGVAEFPTWALGGGHTWPRLRLLVHVHEHMPGHLSLALHPSSRLLASCSSGDGFVKFWDCGRAAHASSSQLMASTDEFVERVASEDDETTPETPDDSLVATEVKIPECDAADDDTFAGRSLPSRSLSSYSVRQPQDALETKQSCRCLVWTESGSSVATLVNNSAIHLVDDSVSCLRSLFPLQTAHHGRATHLTAPATAFCGDDGSPLHSYMLGGTDQNLLVYSTTSGNIVGQDVRVKEPVWWLKQDRMHGLVTCLAVHSGHTWLAAGTIHSHVVIWDLRYRRTISHFILPHNTKTSMGFTRLQLYDWYRRSSHSTLICAATGHHNEVVLFDLDDSNPRQASTTCVAATWTQSDTHSKPLIAKNSCPLPRRGVLSLLLLPPPSTSSSSSTAPSGAANSAAALPTLVTGGHDARLRCWSFAQPDASAVLSWAGTEEIFRPRVSFSEKLVDGVRVVTEEESVEDYFQQQHQSSTPAASKGRRGEAYFSPLDAGDVTVGHTNGVSDLALISHSSGRAFLVSAAMNGVMKFWR
ncbi:Phosphoinositide 3-kinase regulatory subunit 4 [Echinococcus granulosus]|uniref:non-specific serine/threonine protein kinase n=1 Tax=Echinococcus granulosus TaxID=6210 RepID=A0A068X2G7_ECHGR|nr:Phosphoinositide 3-kinase regulatory subunit 4 [Echinococcus granulosus]CDS24178.1 phosphoinositide 3 kinase regulatory subunit 4 [Echinococcus granulosus]